MTTRQFLRKTAVDVALIPVFFAAIGGLFAVLFWFVTAITPAVTP